MKIRVVLLSALVATTACAQSSGPQKLDKVDAVIRGVNYIGLAVDDLEATRNYYAASVSAEVAGSSAIPSGTVLARLHPKRGGAAQTLLLRRTNAQLRLFKFAAPTSSGRMTSAVPVQGPGIAHVCFQVADQTNSHEKMLAAGGAPVGTRALVQLNPQNPVRYGYVKDPRGVITEIEQIDLTKINRPKPPENLYRIRHVSMATANIGKMIAFYSTFLGGQKPRHVGSWINVSGDPVDKVSGLQGSKIEMAWFQLRNLEIEIFQYHSHPTAYPPKARPIDAPGYNMIVFDVSDIGDARRRLIAAGGKMVTPAGPLDGGQISFGRDPDGNLIGLQRLPANSALSAKNFPNNGT